jgi:hypothetical protein
MLKKVKYNSKMGDLHMDTLISDIKKLLKTLASKDEDIQYSDKKLENGIQMSRTIKCYKNTKNYSIYITRFKGFDLDKRKFVRIIVEIPCQNNLRSKNIEIILDALKKLEAYFIYLDYVKLFNSDGLIYLDTYRENKFH